MLHGAAIDETQPGKGSVGGNLARRAGQRQRHNVDLLLNNACTLNYFLKIMHLNKQKQTKIKKHSKKLMNYNSISVVVVIDHILPNPREKEGGLLGGKSPCHVLP